MQDNRTYEIAMVGEASSIAAFRGLGIKTFPIGKDDDLEELVSDLINSKNFAIIYLTARVAEEVSELLKAHQDDYLPALIVLPAANTESDASMQNLKAMSIKALGVDVVSPMLKEDKDLDNEDE